MRLLLPSLCVLFLGMAVFEARADATYAYAVQLSATVQAVPPRIVLSWEADPFGANSYTVYRKAKTATTWGTGTTLSGSTSTYTDTNVTAGVTYEYQLIKAAVPGYTGYGYIYSGINAPLIEGRGTLILVVATNATGSLSNELARLQTDLIGDGWMVLRHDVSSNSTTESVRTMITNDYYAAPTSVNAVFLFGHVPILESGSLDYDGHGVLRAMPADAYYGEMNNDWPTNTATSPSYLPSDVELMVGRVDLFNMPGNAAPGTFPSETELLRNYLNKDHNWRHKLINVQRRALMANRLGDFNGEAFAASGYRNFEPFVGPGNTVEAAITNGAPDSLRWISMVTATNYLWTYGCGGGSYTTIGFLGTNGQYDDVWSVDIVNQNAKAVFGMFFGSWFGSWDVTDDIIRSMLATPTMGLTCCLVGRPHWFFHHMAMGEPIGYSTRLSMNNSTLYQNQSNFFTRAVYIALMGDPTLRLDPVAPPGNLSGQPGTNTVTLSWSASPDTVQGYYVYRATAAAGPFSRVTSSLVTGTSYGDAGLSANTYTYMVRAVKLQTNPSGTYFNPSQGIFKTITVTNSTMPLTVVASKSANGLLLSWNSQSGVAYHVQGQTNLQLTSWANLSSSLTATGWTTFWTDTNITSRPRRFYRVSSP